MEGEREREVVPMENSRVGTFSNEAILPIIGFPFTIRSASIVWSVLPRPTAIPQLAAKDPIVRRQETMSSSASIPRSSIDNSGNFGLFSPGAVVRNRSVHAFMTMF